MKIAVSGATGRMGKLIIEAIINSDDLKLVAAVTAPGVAEIGTDAGASLGKTTGVMISADVQELAKADVLIDFTRPQATLAYLPFCIEHNVGIVIGTTGFDAQGSLSTTVRLWKCTTSTKWMLLPVPHLKWDAALLSAEASILTLSPF